MENTVYASHGWLCFLLCSGMENNTVSRLSVDDLSFVFAANNLPLLTSSCLIPTPLPPQPPHPASDGPPSRAGGQCVREGNVTEGCCHARSVGHLFGS